MQPADPFVATLQKWIEVFMRRSMRNFIRHSKESGFSISQIGALFYIHRQGSCGVSDLGEHLGVTSAAASQMLERLVQQELVLRTEDPQDRRNKLIILNDRGRQMLQESLHARQDWLVELADALSDSEKEPIITALNLLIEKANRLRQPAEPESY